MSPTPPPPPPTHDHVALAAALAAENVSFTTYAIMRALRERDGPASIAGLSIAVGMSYWAVRHQIHRTPWFLVLRDTELLSVNLNPDALAKFARIEKRLQPSAS